MPIEPVDPVDPEPSGGAPLARAQLGWEPIVDRLRDHLASWRHRAAHRPVVTVAAAVLLLGLGVCAWYVLRPPAPPPELALPRATPAAGAGPGSTAAGTAASPTSADAGSATVTVDVVGAVGRPGLVKLPGGSRVADAVREAGGASLDADLERLNMAAALSDGELIYVPHVGETSIPLPVNGSGGAGGVATDPAGTGEAGSTAAPVDLNQADEQQLETLPGVGPSTAEAILDYRRQHGRFKSVDELLDVRGIGPAKLAALRARVRV